MKTFGVKPKSLLPQALHLPSTNGMRRALCRGGPTLTIPSLLGMDLLKKGRPKTAHPYELGGETTRSHNAAFQPRRFTTYERDGNASDEAMHPRYNRVALSKVIAGNSRTLAKSLDVGHKRPGRWAIKLVT